MEERRKKLGEWTLLRAILSRRAKGKEAGVKFREKVDQKLYTHYDPLDFTSPHTHKVGTYG